MYFNEFLTQQSESILSKKPFKASDFKGFPRAALKKYPFKNNTYILCC